MVWAPMQLLVLDLSAREQYYTSTFLLHVISISFVQ